MNEWENPSGLPGGPDKTEESEKTRASGELSLEQRTGVFAQISGRKALRWTVGALLMATFVGIFSVYSYNQGMRHGPQSAQRIVSDVPLEEPSGPYQYILRVQDGRLAVFLKGQKEAQMVFDVAVRVLPEYDQRELENGIYVKDYQTLVRLIEDYVS